MSVRRKVYWSVAAVLVVTGAFVIVGGWIGCWRGLHPERVEELYKPSDFDLPIGNVRFKSRDGLTLAGWFIPGTNGATVVLVHGRGGWRAGMLPHADYLHKNGFSVLLFDLRYRGESEGDVSTLGAKEPLDVEGAIDYLKTRTDVNPERIGVQGNSLGAVAAILAAVETPEIKGVVAEIPFKDLLSASYHSFGHPDEGVGLPSFLAPIIVPISKFFCKFLMDVDFDAVEPSEVIGKISPRPIFLIDDLRDDAFPSDSVEVLYEAAGEHKELWQIPGATHGRGWETAPKEYERRVLAFWHNTFGLSQQ